MSDNRGNSSGAFIAGAIVGGVVGAITGVLLAPRSGRETRQFLKKSADALPELVEDLSSNIQLQADRLSGSASRNWDNTLYRLKESLRAGAQAAANAARLVDDEADSGLEQPARREGGSRQSRATLVEPAELDPRPGVHDSPAS